VQWMCVNYRPWVKSQEDAVKCLAGQGRRRGFRPLARWFWILAPRCRI